MEKQNESVFESFRQHEVGLVRFGKVSCFFGVLMAIFFFIDGTDDMELLIASGFLSCFGYFLTKILPKKLAETATDKTEK